MAEKENVQIVQATYAAFGSGDIPAILNAMADDIDWLYVGRPQDVPFVGRDVDTKS